MSLKTFIFVDGEYKVFEKSYKPIQGNAIPPMTSNTSPSGVASASDYIDINNQYSAFDGTTNTQWAAVGKTTAWLAYKFHSPIKVKKYSITGGVDIYNAKDWTFEGSNDNFVSFDILHTVTNQTNWTLYENREFTITNQNDYKSYRLNITSNNGGTNIYIIQLQMFGDEPIFSFRTVTSTLPTATQFKTEGMDDLTVLDRKERIFTDILMDDNTANGIPLGEGKVFKEKIDLTKFLDIKKIEIQ